MFEGRVVLTWNMVFYGLYIAFAIGLAVVPAWLWRDKQLRSKRRKTNV